MILKIGVNILKGIRGIVRNPDLGIKTKLWLIFDYFRCLGLLVLVFGFKVKINRIRIYSFGYTIYFKNYITFFYLFNDIFGRAVYTPKTIKNYFDLGANIGMTILWYKFFNPNLSVEAFEPNPEARFFLKKNIKENKLKNVKVHSVALSDKKEETTFYVIDDDIQNLDSGLSLNQDLPYRIFKVKTDLFSGYIKETIDLLKLDIEGGEYVVFDELFETKKINYLEQIIFEAHFFNKDQEKKLKEILGKLKKFGRVRCHEKGKLTSIFLYERHKF